MKMTASNLFRKKLFQELLFCGKPVWGELRHQKRAGTLRVFHGINEDVPENGTPRLLGRDFSTGSLSTQKEQPLIWRKTPKIIP